MTTRIRKNIEEDFNEVSHDDELTNFLQSFQNRQSQLLQQQATKALNLRKAACTSGVSLVLARLGATFGRGLPAGRVRERVRRRVRGPPRDGADPRHDGGNVVPAEARSVSHKSAHHRRARRAFGESIVRQF